MHALRAALRHVCKRAKKRKEKKRKEKKKKGKERKRNEKKGKERKRKEKKGKERKRKETKVKEKSMSAGVIMRAFVPRGKYASSASHHGCDIDMLLQAATMM